MYSKWQQDKHIEFIFTFEVDKDNQIKKATNREADM